MMELTGTSHVLCVQDGKTVLEILSDDEAAKIVKERDLYYGEIPD